MSTSAIMERIPSKWQCPVWQAPWRNYRDLVVGSSLNSVNYKEEVRFTVGLAVSNRHTYMFSAGDGKQVKCWDMEQNKAWDIQSKMQINALFGHDKTVCLFLSIDFLLMCSSDDQNTRSDDKKEDTFQQQTIINAITVNEEGVMVTGDEEGGENGGAFAAREKSTTHEVRKSLIQINIPIFIDMNQSKAKSAAVKVVNEMQKLTISLLRLFLKPESSLTSQPQNLKRLETAAATAKFVQRGYDTASQFSKFARTQVSYWWKQWHKYLTFKCD
ncbi:unnamed protein product [Citrullus colocynthis]|uniref:Uncharacterized protein n=1 Tax=Citrullus colocynthis TaxID=252529 RepID=A0ABP0Z871_9ROSI